MPTVKRMKSPAVSLIIFDIDAILLYFLTINNLFNRRQIMSKVIDAIYEDGVFKPLEKVFLKEHERIHIIIEKTGDVESTAIATSGIIPVKSSKVVDMIALEPEFLPEEV